MLIMTTIYWVLCGYNQVKCRIGICTFRLACCHLHVKMNDAEWHVEPSLCMCGSLSNCDELVVSTYNRAKRSK